MKKSLIIFVGLILGAIFYFYPKTETEVPKYVDNIEQPTPKLTGAEKFALYHSNIKKAPEGVTHRYKSGYLVDEFTKAKKQSENNTRSVVNWEERGPGNVSGRTRTVWLDPRDESGLTWFVGSAQGGVWKTEDAGSSYTLKTPDVPHLGTAAIMGCKSVPEVIYAGSGEGFNFLSPAGAGIFKSVDGGETWTVLESTIDNQAFANIFRLAVDPNDPDIVFAATKNDNSLSAVESFIMRSKDGGVTWEEVLFHFDNIADIAMSPDDSNVLFAGLNQEGVLRSIDGGDNWDFVWLFSTGINRPERIELAISPSDPNYVYFTTPINGNDKIFSSTDGGENFYEVVPNNPSRDDISGFSGGQSFWNKAIAVHPFDPTQIYFAGTSAILKLDILLLPELPIGELTVISDGYGQYTDIDDVGTKGVHVDHHGITFSITDAANEEFLLINTNDGGVAVSSDNGSTFNQTGDTFLQGFNPEDGTWTTVDGYNVSTFYGVDKMNGADRYVGGTQDNGSWVSPEDPGAESRWSYAPSGDGFEAAWNYNDSNKIIESSQGNNFSRSLDGGETWDPLPTPGFGPFITAIANSKQDADMVMISTNEGPAVSYDFGSVWETAQMPPEYNYSGLRTPVDISLADPSVAWTGTGVSNFSRICVSTNGGFNFSATSEYTEFPMGEVAGIATHPSDIGTAYATFGVAGMPKILMTNDFGQSWNDISGFDDGVDGISSRGFPDVSVYSLLVMPYDNNIIWAGTEIGVVESQDGGLTWTLIVDDLPATSIWEMKIVNDEVVLATHGRGIWSASLPELDGYEPPVPFLVSSQLDIHLFDKKMIGEINHRSAIDSGRLVVTVEGVGQNFVRSIAIGSFDDPAIEDIDLDFEDFETGDNIYNASIELTVYKDDESRLSRQSALFYDVDADDQVSVYSNDFESGDMDFAVSRSTQFSDDFRVEAPINFADNGLVTLQSPDEVTEMIAILQKPIELVGGGNAIDFQEVLLATPGFEFGEGQFFYQESATIQASKDQGRTWVTMREYSSEAHSEWEILQQNLGVPSDDEYRTRFIDLYDFFEEGDVVYIKLQLNLRGFFNTSWGWIVDDFSVSPFVSTEEEQLSELQITTLQNPFENRTTVILTEHEGKSVNNVRLLDMKGQLIDVNISQVNQGGDIQFDIDGSRLASGLYIFSVDVGNQNLNVKLVRM